MIKKKIVKKSCMKELCYLTLPLSNRRQNPASWTLAFHGSANVTRLVHELATLQIYLPLKIEQISSMSFGVALPCRLLQYSHLHTVCTSSRMVQIPSIRLQVQKSK